MLTKTKLALALALTIGTSFALADAASAAPRHHRHAHPQAWQSGEFTQRPVALPYGNYGGTGGGRFSGPLRTDSAPITGGGY